MSRHSTRCVPDCTCYAQGLLDGHDMERTLVEGVLADAFRRHPESSRDAWQAALSSVSKREYQRGLNEGRADD
jgi:hypothetical protein